MGTTRLYGGLVVDALSELDALFLHLESLDLAMNVSDLLVLDASTCPGGRLRLEDLGALVAGRIHLLPRLRQRPAFDRLRAESPVWVDASLRLDEHLHGTRVPSPGGPAQLARAASEIHVRPLDLRRPLWEIHLLHGLAGTRTGLLVKWHHALADAMAGLAMTRRLLERSPGATVEPPVPRAAQAAPGPVAGGPAPPADEQRRVQLGLESILVAGRTPLGPFRSPNGDARAVVLGELSFAEARQTRVGLGVTMNELVLTIVAAGMSGLLGARGVAVPSLRAMVPVLAGGCPRHPASGNHSSYLLLDLPVGTMEERVRLRLVSELLSRERFARAAASRAGGDASGAGAPGLPAAVASRPDGHDYAQLIVTHVAGPLGALHIAGARLLSAHALIPLGSGVPLGVAVVSMGDRMGLAFTADAAQFPDLDRLAVGAHECYEQLRREAEAGPARRGIGLDDPTGP
jgi:diacylglycerol O-acyltransferase / wax synthase